MEVGCFNLVNVTVPVLYEIFVEGLYLGGPCCLHCLEQVQNGTLGQANEHARQGNIGHNCTIPVKTQEWEGCCTFSLLAILDVFCGE